MLHLTVKKKLGGMANFNFLATANEQKLLLKILNPDLVTGCRNFETVLRQILNQENSSVRTAKSVWKCHNVSIDHFLDNVQDISTKNFLESDSYFGTFAFQSD